MNSEEAILSMKKTCNWTLKTRFSFSKKLKYQFDSQTSHQSVARFCDIKWNRFQSSLYQKYQNLFCFYYFVRKNNSKKNPIIWSSSWFLNSILKITPRFVHSKTMHSFNTNTETHIWLLAKKKLKIHSQKVAI